MAIRMATSTCTIVLADTEEEVGADGDCSGRAIARGVFVLSLCRDAEVDVRVNPPTNDCKGRRTTSQYDFWASTPLPRPSPQRQHPPDHIAPSRRGAK